MAGLLVGHDTVYAQGNPGFSPPSATFRDAGIPAHGELWFELLPSVESWDHVFAESREGNTVAAGARVPLHGDLEGPIVARLFPGPEALTADLNADAADLGFQAVSAEDLSMGALDFGAVHAQVRRLEMGFELGLLNRLSLETRAPLTLTEVEAHFAFNATSVTFAPGPAAFENPAGLLGGVRQAVDELEALLASGDLSAEEEAQAMALLDAAVPFLAALDRRISEGRLLPLGGTPAGMQLAMFYGALETDFAGFGLSLPGLGLREEALPEDLASFFSGPPISGTAPSTLERGWTVPEIRAGLRLGLLDQFGAREGMGPIRLRTAIGMALHFPIGTSSEAPLGDPDVFVGVPLRGADRMLEVAAYQDVAIGDLVLLNLAGLYAVRRAEESTLRVHPPERPFALAETRTPLRRDPGDVFALRAVPQLRLNPSLSIGVEYWFQRWASDTYEPLGTDAAPFDPSLLEQDSGGNLHRLGLSVQLRTGRAEPGGASDPRTDPEGGRTDDDAAGRSDAAGAAWQLGFTLQGALGGRGGRVPASQRVAASLRLPLRLF